MSKSRKAGSNEFRNKLEERKGTKWYDAASERGDLYDPRVDDNGGKLMYSGAEVRAEMRDGREDMTTEQMTKYYEDGYKDGSINLNGNAKEFLREKHGAILERAKKDNADPKPAPAPTPAPSTGTPSGNNSPVQSGTTSGNRSPVINQNTDGGGAVAVGGDNSGTIDNSVDNSRTYEGSDRTFNYTGGRGESSLYDTPVSMATMGGFYDVDDSPSAGQAFLDRYITSNNDSQSESDAAYKKSGSFDYNSMADSSRAFNPEEMQARIDNSPLLSRDRSKIQLGKLFGDMDNFDPGEFLLPKPPKPVTSRVGDIAGEYKSGM